MDEIFVIAEIGHNHQGSIHIAKKLISEAKLAGANAVKFQKRDNKNLYTKEFYNSNYDNPNSFGKTYGLHREALELNKAQYIELIKFSKKIGIELFATPFDFNSVDFLDELKVPYYKIASADLTNIPLQKYIAKKNKPVFLSTGGGNINDVNRAVKNILTFNRKLSVLHCTASYPAKIQDMNLNVIEQYKKKFPKLRIGLSDHENGIDASTIAYMLGARVFEKHFTLNRANKGTDNSFSLEPQGLAKMIRNLKRVKILLGDKNKKVLKNELEPLFKMKKSIVIKEKLKKGSIINKKHVTFKSPGKGLDPYLVKKFIGKKINCDLNKDDYLFLRHIKNEKKN
tara:strand:+ start:787 stop:1809 length:1023 start_codon:yes stop_codon:yes gene_type:complete